MLRALYDLKSKKPKTDTILATVNVAFVKSFIRLLPSYIKHVFKLKYF